MDQRFHANADLKAGGGTYLRLLLRTDSRQFIQRLLA
jgi:hypothetical protein